MVARCLTRAAVSRKPRQSQAARTRLTNRTRPTSPHSLRPSVTVPILAKATYQSFLYSPRFLFFFSNSFRFGSLGTHLRFLGLQV